MSNYAIGLDVHDMSAPVSLNVKQGESGQIINISLRSGGKPYLLPSGSYAVFAGKKPDGKILWNSCQVVRHTIQYEITKQTTAVVGWVPVQIRIYKPDGKLLLTPDFVLIVDAPVAGDEEVIAVSENEITALTELVSEAATLQKAVFTAQYGTTTYAEIKAARDEGQVVLCKMTASPLVLKLHSVDQFGAHFTSFKDGYNTIWSVSTEDVWSVKTDEYPTKDEVAGLVKFTAEYGVTTLDEILEAQAAGKVIVCVRVKGGAEIPLYSAGETGGRNAYFSAFLDGYNVAYFCGSAGWSDLSSSYAEVPLTVTISGTAASHSASEIIAAIKAEKIVEVNMGTERLQVTAWDESAVTVTCKKAPALNRSGALLSCNEYTISDDKTVTVVANSAISNNFTATAGQVVAVANADPSGPTGFKAIDVREEFIATYGTTTFAEIYDAMSANKAVYCKNGNVTLPMTACSAQSLVAEFGGVTENGNVVWKVTSAKWSSYNAELNDDCVKTVNGIAPDENGNVQIETGGGSGGAVISSVEPADDDIPKVYFTGTLPTSKSEGDLQLFMRYVSKTARYEYPVTLKVQGGSSADYAKKNFTLKPYADDTYESKVKLSFKNWGKLNKFVLKAHWVDHSHVRNVGTAKIWGKIVASRSDYDSLPEELRNAPNNGATDGFTCKVFCNGVYQGLYEWIVPKDKLFGQDSDIATHSILNSEWNNQPSCAFSTTSPTVSGNWSEELQDSMSSDISTSFANFIKFVAGSTDEEFVANAENYFDVQSVIDFNIFARVFCIVDNLCRNQIFFTYDGVKWYEGCWDVDGVLGLPPTTRGWYPYNTEFQSGYIAYTDFGVTNMLYKRVETLFADRFKERYAELRANVLSADNIIEVYERLTDVITTYEGLLEEDYAKTTGNGAFTGIPYTDSNNIQQLRNFVAQRLPYMDDAVEAIGSDNGGGDSGGDETEVPCTGITLSASTLNFATQDPQTLTATVTPDGCTDAVVWSSDNEAIAVVNNGLVTPYGDGSCTITATCGNYSATCAVTVADGLFSDSAQLVELVANTGANASNLILISSNPGHPGGAVAFSTSSWGGHGTSDYVEIKEGFDCIEVLASKVKLGFYDSDKTILKSADAGDIIDKFICAIPEGSVYYRVSVSTSGMTDYVVPVRYHNLSEYKVDVAWKADPAYLILEDGSVGEGTYYMTEKAQIPDGASTIICDSSAYEKYRQAQIAVYDASDALLNLQTNWVNGTNYTATLVIASYENPTYAYFAMMNPQTAGTTGTEQIVIYAL